MPLPRCTSRRGTALPLAVLVIAVLGVAIVATTNRTSAERQVSSDHQAQLDAFTVAQSGLEQYFSTVTGMPPASTDTTITTLPGGTAQIALRRLRDSAGTIAATFVVASTGTNTAATRYGARVPSAQRTVAQFAVWTPATFDIDAAFTSLSGFDKNGVSGAMDGNDACAGSGKPAIPGVAVPAGTYTGSMNPINGNPDNAPKYIGTPGPTGTAKDSVHIDWAGIKAGTSLPPDYTVPTNGWPTATQMNSWPVIMVNGDLSLNGASTDGKGILIVTGDLTLSGSYQFDGIVLVGGTLTSNGNNTIMGAVITGLNVKTGTNVAQEAVGNGNKTFQYHSCNIANALNHVGSLQRLQNGWTDTWSSY
jgi:hypothetical protein